MVKETKEATQNVQEVITEKAREIWLAGLGVFSTVEEEGSKLFNKFLEKGKELEEKGEKFEKKAKEKVGTMPTLDEIGKYVEEKMNLVFDKVGISPQHEVKNLTEKVDKLTESVEKLAKKLEENMKKSAAGK